MQGLRVAFDHKINFQFPFPDVHELRADAGPAPFHIIFPPDAYHELRGQIHHAPSRIFPDLLDREPSKIKPGGEKKRSLQRQDIQKFTPTETIKTLVILAPEGRDRRRADFYMAIHGDRKMNPQERIAEVRHRVHMGPHRALWL